MARSGSRQKIPGFLPGVLQALRDKMCYYKMCRPKNLGAPPDTGACLPSELQ